MDQKHISSRYRKTELVPARVIPAHPGYKAVFGRTNITGSAMQGARFELEDVIAWYIQYFGDMDEFSRIDVVTYKHGAHLQPVERAVQQPDGRVVTDVGTFMSLEEFRMYIEEKERIIADSEEFMRHEYPHGGGH